MEDHIELGLNVFPIQLQYHGDENGETFEMLPGRSFCRIQFRDVVLDYEAPQPRLMIPTPALLGRGARMAHHNDNLNSSVPLRDHSLLSVMHNTLGVAQVEGMCVIWTRTFTCRETPYIIMYNPQSSPFNLRDFSNTTLFMLVNRDLYHRQAQSWPSRAMMDGYLTVSPGRGVCNSILATRVANSRLAMDARLQLFVMWLFDQVWDREKQTFWMPSGRDGLLSIRNRERLLTYYGPGSLAVDPGVSETSGLFVSVEAQQRAANVQENFLAQELLDAETSLADSVRAASMHRAALRQTAVDDSDEEIAAGDDMSADEDVPADDRSGNALPSIGGLLYDSSNQIVSFRATELNGGFSPTAPDQE
jgi:hypothetical protein